MIFQTVRNVLGGLLGRQEGLDAELNANDAAFFSF